MPQEEKDLKTEEKASDSTGQEENKQGSEGKEDPYKDLTPEELKARLAKTEEDRDHYREGLLNSKKDRSLSEKKEEKSEADDDEEDSKVDLEKIKKETAEAVFSKIYEKNEKAAVKDISKKYPDLIDDRNWGDFIKHYRATRGKESVQDIMEDLEDAYLLYKRGRGEQIQSQDFNKGKEAGKAEAKKAELASVAGEGKRDEGQPGAKVSPQQEAMAKAFGHDPQKVYSEENPK